VIWEGKSRVGDKNGQPLLVGVGEVLWDLLPTGKQLGGAPTNFAYHAGALGGRGALVSAVGDDALGRDILQRMREAGMPTEFVHLDATHPTGTVEVEVDGVGVPTFIIHTNVAWDFVPLTPATRALAERADAVCFGSLGQRGPGSRRTIQDFLAATRPQALRIFDVNLRQRFYNAELIEQSLKRCSVLKLNDQELPVLADLLKLRASPLKPQAVVAELRERYNLRVVALTCGASGSLLCDAESISTHPGVRVQVVDTVGAGDAFTAALALGLLRGKSLGEINHFANQVAAFVCSRAGGTPAYEGSGIRPGA
jgi:fructokinase